MREFLRPRETGLPVPAEVKQRHLRTTNDGTACLLMFHCSSECPVPAPCRNGSKRPEESGRGTLRACATAYSSASSTASGIGPASRRSFWNSSSYSASYVSSCGAAPAGPRPADAVRLRAAANVRRIWRTATSRSFSSSIVNSVELKPGD